MLSTLEEPSEGPLRSLPKLLSGGVFASGLYRETIKLRAMSLCLLGHLVFIDKDCVCVHVHFEKREEMERKLGFVIVKASDTCRCTHRF